MVAHDVFRIWARIFESEPKAWARFAGRYRWVVQGDSGGTCTLDCTLRPQVLPDDRGTADFEIRLSAEDFFSLLRRELNPQHALLERRIQLIGRTKHVLRFNLLLESLLLSSALHPLPESAANSQ